MISWKIKKIKVQTTGDYNWYVIINGNTLGSLNVNPKDWLMDVHKFIIDGHNPNTEEYINRLEQGD